MEIISRHYIHQDIKYYDGLDLVCKDINDFNHAINFWKIILYEGYGLRPGNLIGVYDRSIRFNYVSLIFAAAELGLILVMIPDRPKNDKGEFPKLESIISQFGLMELAILDERVNEDAMPEFVAMAHKYGKKVITTDAYNTYTIKDNDLYARLSETIYPSPSDTFVLTTSSGSISAPRVVLYSHQSLYRIGIRNAELAGFQGKTMCHIRNMHHPFVLVESFLPGLRYCPVHYSQANMFKESTTGDFIKLLMDYKIGVVLLAWKEMLDNSIAYMIEHNLKFEHKIEIFVGGFLLTSDYIEKLKSVNIYQLHSSYGESSVKSPIFVKVINQNTDYDTFRDNSIGLLVDDFYSVEIVPEGIKVLCPSMFEGSKIIDDKIEKHGDEYFFLGRDNLLRINEIEFNLSEISDIVGQNFKGDFDVSVDMKYQKLYLAVWSGDPDVNKINQACKDKYDRLYFFGVKKLDKPLFTSGIKLDQDALRCEFRKDFL